MRYRLDPVQRWVRAPGIGMALAAMVLAACDRGPRVAVIGYAFPYHGRTNVALAREEVEELASSDQVRISIVYDSAGTIEPADIEVERAQRNVAMPGIVAVVGHGGSRGSLAGAPVYNEARIPQLVPLGTSRLLRLAGPWTFMLAPDDSIEGEFIGRFLTARTRSTSPRVTIFYVNEEYGVGLRDGVAAALAARGNPVFDQVPIRPGGDLTTLIDASLARGIPDVIVSGARAVETATIASIVWQRGHRIPIVAGDGALQLPELAVVSGAAADSIFVVAFWTPDSPDSASRAFVERFRRLTGREPTSAAAMSHDALMLTVRAIRDVGPDPTAIRDYFRSLGESRPPYRGVTGPITFRPDRPTRLNMVRLSNGRPIRVIGPRDPI